MTVIDPDQLRFGIHCGQRNTLFAREVAPALRGT